MAVSNLPDAAKTKWPMGDVLPSGGLPANLDATIVAKAVDAAFESQGQLYNLANDLGETKNLYAEHPVIVEPLRNKLADIRAAPTAQR